MILKKCSAAAALLGILCLAGHMGTMCFSLFTGWYVLDLCKGLAHLTLYCIAVHALLSVCSVFFFHDGADAGYRKENRRWLFQRATAILIVLLLHVHTRAYGHMATGEVLTWWEAFLYCCSEVLYIASVTVHAAVSFSRAFVTFGWVKSQKAVRRIDRGAGAVCGAAGVCAAAAVIRFFLGV